MRFMTLEYLRRSPAHSLSTAMKADRIVVVDQGAIIEIGSHDELVAQGGRYAEMYATWTSHSGGVPSGDAAAALSQGSR